MTDQEHTETEHPPLYCQEHKNAVFPLDKDGEFTIESKAVEYECYHCGTHPENYENWVTRETLEPLCHCTNCGDPIYDEFTANANEPFCGGDCAREYNDRRDALGTGVARSGPKDKQLQENQ